MSIDYLGPIPIPEPEVVSPFPLTSDYGGGVDYELQVATHVFDQEDLFTEQRYLMGPGTRRFRITKDHLSCDEYDALKSHWLDALGQYAQFDLVLNKPDGTTETVTARYENPNLQFNHLIGYLTSDPGLTLLEVPAVTPSYTSAATVTRFPDDVLTPALESQVQQFIPLITISPRGTTDILRVSNQRCTVDDNLYLPRLLDWNGISQTINETSDSAQFTLGNADDVWVQYANTVNLFRARIDFALFHVNTNYMINLWSGYARQWTLTSDGVFVLPASDGVFELTMGYPWRQISRTCWKVYKGPYCPSTSTLTTCPKDFAACVARGVPASFGGCDAEAQTVILKDNSTGTWGFGRSEFVSVSVQNDTVYQRPVQEIYTDYPMKVNADVAAGRDESEFYSALGIVSEGPIGGFNDKNLFRQTLDGVPPHDPFKGGGWRGILGTDPAGWGDFFALDQAPWAQNVKGSKPNSAALPGSGNAEHDAWYTLDTGHLWVFDGSNYIDTGLVSYAAGVAFAEIRRIDIAGRQLTSVAERAMVIEVANGIGGWVWTAPGARYFQGDPHDTTTSRQTGLTNPVWVAVNVYLRGIGLRVDKSRGSLIDAATMEQTFDVDAAIAAAALCDEMVASMITPDGPLEKRFTFHGVLKEKKPLKDWIQEILNGCCGYYTFVAGKLWIGIRSNSSVLAGNPFTRANILFKSLQATPVTPRFNWLVGQFGDQEFDFQLNNVTLYDIDHATWMGDGSFPQYLTSQMSFVGVSTKSECARVVTTRLREELGGAAYLNDDGTTNLSQFVNGRNLKFRTTLLALRTMVGDIISLDHERLPAGRGEARVQNWVLNPDFSIDIQASCTTDSMYNPAFGIGPADVPAVPPPGSRFTPSGVAWMPNLIGPITDSGGVSLDPLYPDARERTFDLWQDYSITRDGVWAPALWVSGEECVNRYAAIHPRVVGVDYSAGGGYSGPMTVYVAIVQTDATGLMTAPSNIWARWIPPTATNQKLTIDLFGALTGGPWTGWDLYVGADRRRMALQGSFSGDPPASYDLIVPLCDMTREMPEATAQRVRICAKHVWHSGVAGVLVTGVPAANQIQVNDWIGSTDDWVGPPFRYVSALSDLSDGSAPLWNFRITAFDSTTGTLTVTPDCVRASPADSVQPGDVLITRSIATSSGPNWVEDTLWNNFVSRHQFPGTAGLRPHEEIGRLCRIVRGKGIGQLRNIVENTEIRITVDPPWTIQPDETSIVIVEEHNWDYAAVTSQLVVPRAGAVYDQRMAVDNLANLVALVGGFLVDDQGRITDEEYAVFREIFIYGQPPTVRIVGPQTLDPATGDKWAIYVTDQTVRADTRTHDVEVQLLPLADYHGRTLYLVNDDGPHNLIVYCADTEALFDGLTSATVGPFQTIRVTAGVTS